MKKLERKPVNHKTYIDGKLINSYVQDKNVYSYRGLEVIYWGGLHEIKYINNVPTVVRKGKRKKGRLSGKLLLQFLDKKYSEIHR